MKNTVTDNVKTKAILTGFADGKALFTMEDGADFSLDKKMVPKEAKTGGSFILTVCSEETEKSKQTKRARDLLNEILNI